MAFIFNALVIHNNLEQLLETIKRCAVTNLVVISNRDRSILNEQRLYHLREQFKVIEGFHHFRVLSHIV